jgi:16S rRNA (guanine1207-N2)-methyltransferase
MIIDAFIHAMGELTIPKGPQLWLYGDSRIASGDAYQPRHDQAQALERRHCRVFSHYEAIEGQYDAVFVECPRQREETEGLLALALQHSTGFVMAVAANDAGGGRLPGLMESYGIATGSLSKSHCRIVWTDRAAQADPQRLQAHLAQLALRQITIGEERWWSVPGLFGWDKIDAGSQLLLSHIPSGISGNIADFGCGFGYLSAGLARHFPAITRIDAYDVDARAVAACARNGTDKIHPIWQDIRTLPPRKTYDYIVMNPPFHTGKQDDAGLGQAFIHKAWESLAPGGSLYLVANRHLPYEKTVPGLEVLFEDRQYKIITGHAA